MSRSALEYLRHILDEARYLENSTRGLREEDFLGDETRKRAFVRSLEIIGEPAKNVPNELKQKYPNIDWKAMAGMRDHLIHRYFSTDYEIVWDVVANKIPALIGAVQQMLEEESLQ